MTNPSLEGHERRGLHLAVIAIALALVVYCAFLVIGIVFRLLFIAGALALGLVAWRAWRASS